MSFFSYANAIVKQSFNFRYSLFRKKNIENRSNFSSITTKTIHDVNTNVVKDVILFKYENPKFFRYMNAFAVVQYIFWTYLGVFALKNLKDAPVDRSSLTEDTPWFRKINLGENKYRNTLGAISVIVGEYKYCLI